MKFRKLRIACSVACGIACVLLIALWVLSISRRIAIWTWYPPNGYYIQATSDRGAIYLSRVENNPGPTFKLGSSLRAATPNTPINWGFDSQQIGGRGISFTYKAPHWFFVLVFAI